MSKQRNFKYSPNGVLVGARQHSDVGIYSGRLGIQVLKMGHGAENREDRLIEYAHICNAPPPPPQNILLSQ